MIYIIAATKWVLSDSFFWPSMAFTTMVGIFIGAIVYDGIVGEVKKMIVSLSCYASLITIVNLTRVLPVIEQTSPNKIHQPLASVVTMLLVTIFYLLGTYIGVRVTKKAHKIL